MIHKIFWNININCISRQLSLRLLEKSLVGVHLQQH